MNTSADGGFLEVKDEALLPEQLEDVLHDVIVGITKLGVDLVRPRWQPNPPTVPEADINWCAFGVSSIEPQNLPVWVHKPDKSELINTFSVHVLLSFFGPDCMFFARRFRLGIYVPQNRTLLRPARLGFVKTGMITPVPEQVALNWRKRADMTAVFNWQIESSVPILDFQSFGTNSFLNNQTEEIPL